MMIHGMAQHIFYKGEMYHYDDLLRELGRGVHFAIYPDGQVVQHAAITALMYHARGANRSYVGVELLVPGVYDLDALWRKIDTKPMMAYDVYTREQYLSLRLLQGFLASHSFILNPKTDWNLHSVQSMGRKRDPGMAFSVQTWKELLDGFFI